MDITQKFSSTVTGSQNGFVDELNTLWMDNVDRRDVSGNACVYIFVEYG